MYAKDYAFINSDDRMLFAMCASVGGQIEPLFAYNQPARMLNTKTPMAFVTTDGVGPSCDSQKGR